jgi:hypothetical protein
VLLLNSNAHADLTEGRQKFKSWARLVWARRSAAVMAWRGGRASSSCTGAGGHFDLKKLGSHCDEEMREQEDNKGCMFQLPWHFFSEE